MADKHKQWLKLIAEIQALSQSGLTFTDNPFDVERYERLTAISAELAASCSAEDVNAINEIFAVEKGYATPKIDVRSFVIRDNKVLLVRERSDNRWTLPGGFADVTETPSQAVVRETKEESGFDVAVVKLLAFWDKLRHDHPLQWPHIYKCFFHCEFLSGKAQANLEISEVDFFALDKIPELSTPRVTEKQIHALYDLLMNAAPTDFD